MNQKFHRKPIPVRVKDDHRDGHQERVQNVALVALFRVTPVAGVENARAQYPNGETRQRTSDVIRRRKRRKSSSIIEHHFFSTIPRDDDNRRSFKKGRQNAFPILAGSGDDDASFGSRKRPCVACL